MFRPVFTILLSSGCLLCAHSLLAQKIANSPAPIVAKPPIMDTQRPSTPQNDLANRGMYIMGKVQLDEGVPPPASIVIEKVCENRRMPVAYTDNKGRFSFQIGGGNALMPDASESMSGFSSGQPTNVTTNGTPQSPANILMNCELVAVLPGYRSDVAYLGQHRQLDNPDVGTMVLHRLNNVPGTIISATTLNAPKDALKAYEKGLDDVKKAKTEAAEKDFSRAVELHPTFAAAWYQLGHLLRSDPARARDALQHSIAADGKYVSPYLDLALIEISQRNWPVALDAAAKGVHLNPVDFPQLYFYKAVAEFNMKQLDEAEKSVRQAEKLDVEHRVPKIEHLLGTLLIEKHGYTEAAVHLKAYLTLAPDATDAAATQAKLTQLERVAAVTPEQAKP